MMTFPNRARGIGIAQGPVADISRKFGALTARSQIERIASWGPNMARFIVGVNWPGELTGTTLTIKEFDEHDTDIESPQNIDMWGNPDDLNSPVGSLLKLIPLCHEYGMAVTLTVSSYAGRYTAKHERIIDLANAAGFPGKFGACEMPIQGWAPGTVLADVQAAALRQHHRYLLANLPRVACREFGNELEVDDQSAKILWTTIFPELHALIRVHDKTCHIGFSDYTNDYLTKTYTSAADFPILDSRLLCVSHFYKPFQFTFQPYGANLQFPGTYGGMQGNAAQIEAETFKPLDAFRAKFGIRINMNEFGAMYSCPEPARSDWHTAITGLIEKYGFDGCVLGVGYSCPEPTFNLSIPSSDSSKGPQADNVRIADTVSGTLAGLLPWWRLN